jgi:hypothetical protein
MADPQSLLQPGETLGPVQTSTPAQAPVSAPNPSDSSSLLQPGETLGPVQGPDNGQSTATPPANPMGGVTYPAGTKYTQATQYGGPAHQQDDPTNVLRGAGSEALGALEGAIIPPGVKEIYQGVTQDIPAVFKAYENARAQGKNPIQAVSAANDAAKKISDAKNVFEQRAKEFSTNPNRATGKLLVDIIPFLMGAGIDSTPETGAAGESEAVGGSSEPETPTETPSTPAPAKPGIIKSVIKGGNVVKQPEIQGAVRSGVNAASEEAGASTVQPESIRDSASGHISALEDAEDAAYKAQDEAAGTDIKQLRKNLDNAKYQKSLLTKTPADVAKAKDLDTSIQATQDEIDAANDRLQKAGIDPGAADHLYKARQAAQEFEDKVLHNQSVVKGDATAGQPESVDVDSLVRESQKLYDKDKYGSSRLEQFMGKDGAASYMKQIRGLQTARMTAAARQAGALKVLKALGIGGGILGGIKILGHIAE